MARHSRGPHPDPPDDFPARALPLRTTRGPWVRLHACRREPVSFGRTRAHRFDAAGGEFGVLYAAADMAGAFIEAFGDPLDLRMVSRRDLARGCATTLTAKRPLRLVDLTGDGLNALGADTRLTSGAHGPAQRWAVHLWAHPQHVDGIAYPARDDPAREAVAIFDRARAAVLARRVRPLTADVRRVADIIDRYAFALID
jgi:hypothetical protein